MSKLCRMLDSVSAKEMNWGKEVNAGAGCQGCCPEESEASPRGGEGGSPRSAGRGDASKALRQEYRGWACTEWGRGEG